MQTMKSQNKNFNRYVLSDLNIEHKPPTWLSSKPIVMVGILKNIMNQSVLLKSSPIQNKVNGQKRIAKQYLENVKEKTSSFHFLSNLYHFVFSSDLLGPLQLFPSQVQNYLKIQNSFYKISQRVETM